MQQINGKLPSDISGNADTVTNGLYTTILISHSIIKADVSGQPLALPIPTNTIVGRQLGDIVCLTPSTLLLMQQINGKLPSDISGNSDTVTNGLYTTILIEHSIIKADVAGHPVALPIPTNTIVGRQLDDIVCLTPSALLFMQQINGKLPSDISGNANTVTNGLYTTILIEHSIIKADVAGQPVVLPIPTNTIVGRQLDDIVCLSPSTLLLMQQINGKLPTDISGNANTVTNGLYTTILIEHSIIKADVAGQPVVLPIPTNTIVGRQLDDIVCLSPSTLLLMQQINGKLPTDISGNANTVTNGLYTTILIDHSIIKADVAGLPVVLPIPTNTIVGRQLDDIVCLSPSTLLLMQQINGKLPTDISGNADTVTNGLYTTILISHSIIKADVAGVPVALAIPSNTIVGRKDGDITCLTPAELLSMQQINGKLPTDISGNAHTVTNGVYTSAFSQDNCILKADTAQNPIALPVPENTLVGRLGVLPIGPLTRDAVRRFLDESTTSFDTLTIDSDVVRTISVVSSTTRIIVTGNATPADILTCTLPDGPYDGFRKTMLILELHGKTLYVNGRLFSPRQLDSTKIVFNRNFQSITLEWVLGVNQWVCIHTEWSSPAEDFKYLGTIPDAGSYRLSLVDNVDGFSAFVPLPAPNGSYAITVTDVVDGGATASFLVCGSVAMGGHLLRTSGMPGQDGERLQMSWIAGSMPSLSYLRRPNTGSGTVLTYRAFVIGVGYDPAPSPVDMQPTTRFYQEDQVIALVDNNASFSVPLSFIQSTGAYFVEVTSDLGAQALFSVCGTWGLGGSVNTLSNAKGTRDEQLTIQWLPQTFPSLSYRRLPNIATGSIQNYAVKVWGSASPDASRVSPNTSAMLRYASLSSTAPSVSISMLTCTFLLFACDDLSPNGTKAIFQIVGVGSVSTLCARTGAAGETLQVEWTDGVPKITLDHGVSGRTYRIKILTI